MVKCCRTPVLLSLWTVVGRGPQEFVSVEQQFFGQVKRNHCNNGADSANLS